MSKPKKPRVDPELVKGLPVQAVYVEPRINFIEWLLGCFSMYPKFYKDGYIRNQEVKNPEPSFAIDKPNSDDVKPRSIQPPSNKIKRFGFFTFKKQKPETVVEPVEVKEPVQEQVQEKPKRRKKKRKVVEKKPQPEQPIDDDEIKRLRALLEDLENRQNHDTN